MTGLEPHPIFTLPTREQALALEQALGREAAAERLNALIETRRKRMELERDDPFQHGYESPIWHVVDDLLVDGKDVLLILPDGVDVPKAIIKGAPEIQINGSNRSGKSEYAGKKVMKILEANAEARTWSFADTESISIARQQPIFWKYLPAEIKRLASVTGKLKYGPNTKISYSQGNGFTGGSFVLPNRAQHWFKNYKQNPADMEGDQMDAIWLDELRDPELLRTLRVRLGDRDGLLIVTFTSADENYSAIVNEYDRGSRTVLEAEAELLPIRDAQRRPTGKFKPVPRVKVAGPGSDGNQRANIVYFHITDNPYYGFTAKAKPGARIIFGKERFYRLWRGAIESKILSRVYGILTQSAANKFPRFNDRQEEPRIHVVPAKRIPLEGTNYLIADPVAGRNWFMLWMRVHPHPIVRPDGSTAFKRSVYREWPSYGHDGLTAYIPGVGSLGQWALPGKAADGEQGPAQNALGWGLDRYLTEILRVEGREGVENRRPEAGKEGTGNGVDLGGEKVRRVTPRNPLFKQRGGWETAPPGEIITERLMDSRYGAKPTQTNERTTTLIEQMSEKGMEFLPASGRDIGEGVQMINDALDYDPNVPLGEYSPALSRMNEPLLQISEECPNLIFALKTWTFIDKLLGATKDPVDCLRYGFEHDLQFIGVDAFAWGKY